MAIILAGQGIVALFFRAVSRLLQTTQHSVMDSVDIRLADRLLQDTLEREAVGFTLDFVAQNASELGERLELIRLRRRVNPAQEWHAETGKLLGHRFIGGQHEFLNDLMA